MSIMEDMIRSRLEPAENKPEHHFTVLISASRVKQIKQIAKVMSSISGRRVTQTMLFKDAVDVFIEKCLADPELRSRLLASDQEVDSQQQTVNDSAGLAPEQEPDGQVMSL